uniref:Uncharacterized protein n=1 Tax=Eubacterium cellulosolvens (strain ATCC 43171 / JCM 9499 / 6) TaxID=633697 RepID=I5ASR6_EUBC6
MRVAMSHALVKKTPRTDACIRSRVFFCKHTANAATTRNAKHSEFVGMATLRLDALTGRSEGLGEPKSACGLCSFLKKQILWNMIETVRWHKSNECNCNLGVLLWKISCTRMRCCLICIWYQL